MTFKIKPQPKNSIHKKSDFRQEVTNEVIEMIEAGTAPWIRPWQAGEIAAAFNPTTNMPYRGGNIIALMCASLRKGYKDPRWMTYRQAAEKGWRVRKGEKASRIEFFKDELIEDEATGEKTRRAVARHYPVFNAQQIDGVPKLDVPKKEQWEAIKAGERIVKKSGAVIKYGGDRAYYHTVLDYIQLPNREDFYNAAMFYSTACHELAHWTGHSSRLNRVTCTSGRNSEDYAREELVAELASLFVSAETGLPFDPSQHAAYIKSWLRALKKDKNEIFRAASSAGKATDHLLQVKKPKTGVGLVELPEQREPIGVRRCKTQKSNGPITHSTPGGAASTFHQLAITATQSGSPAEKHERKINFGARMHSV